MAKQDEELNCNELANNSANAKKASMLTPLPALKCLTLL